MTAAELIAELSKMPQDAHVWAMGEDMRDQDRGAIDEVTLIDGLVWLVDDGCEGCSYGPCARCGTTGGHTSECPMVAFL